MKYAGGIVTALIAVALGGGVTVVTIAQEDVFDCTDFATQNEALEQLDANDTFNLDEDNDGIPCEELPSGEIVEEEAPVIPPVDPEDLDLDEDFSIQPSGKEKD